MIAENLKNVRSRIAEVCRTCGRNPEDVTLVAVSKTFPMGDVRTAYEAGQRDFGENYVQEWLEKRTGSMDLDIRWHLIGHIQSNKAKAIVQGACLIHSLDSMSLAEELNKRLAATGNSVDVLIEVHSTDEATKFGVLPADVHGFAKRISELPRLRVRGLMTMGPFADDPERSRPSFRMLRELRDAVATLAIPGVEMQHLSMGMTHDMDVAIQEGATIVRIGTAIFGRRTKRDAV